MKDIHIVTNRVIVAEEQEEGEKDMGEEDLPPLDDKFVQEVQLASLCYVRSFSSFY